MFSAPASSAKKSKVARFLKILGFALLFTVFWQVIARFIPFHNLYYAVFIRVMPLFSSLFIIGFFIASFITLFLMYLPILLLFVGYAWSVSRFLKPNAVSAVVGMFITVVILNGFFPVPFKDSSTIDRKTADEAISLIAQTYYPLGTSYPLEEAAPPPKNLDEDHSGVLRIQLTFRNTFNRPLELNGIRATDEAPSYLISCQTASFNEVVAVGETQESTHWCVIKNPEKYDQRNQQAGDSPLILRKMRSVPSAKEVIINGHPIQLQLDFSTNVTEEDARLGILPTVSYPFETAAQDWY